MTEQARRRAWKRGLIAETACAASLMLRGYRILGRRLKSPVGEIDILARRGQVLAVIEVKARDDPVAAAEAVTPRQQERLVRAAGWIVAGRPALAALELRFDVMIVTPWRWPDHIVDAWRAGPQRLNSRGEVSW